MQHEIENLIVKIHGGLNLSAEERDYLNRMMDLDLSTTLDSETFPDTPEGRIKRMTSEIHKDFNLIAPVRSFLNQVGRDMTPEEFDEMRRFKDHQVWLTGRLHPAIAPPAPRSAATFSASENARRMGDLARKHEMIAGTTWLSPEIREKECRIAEEHRANERRELSVTPGRGRFT